MKITRKQVLNILKYLDKNKKFYFPFKIICCDLKEGDDFYGVDCIKMGYEVFKDNILLQNFLLEENLQKLDSETVELMAKGFFERIEKDDIISKVSSLAEEYRKSWKEDLWESTEIEEYGLNEFIGGKAEAYEDCLQLLKKYLK